MVRTPERTVCLTILFRPLRDATKPFVIVVIVVIVVARLLFPRSYNCISKRVLLFFYPNDAPLCLLRIAVGCACVCVCACVSYNVYCIGPALSQGWQLKSLESLSAFHFSSSACRLKIRNCYCRKQTIKSRLLSVINFENFTLNIRGMFNAWEYSWGQRFYSMWHYGSIWTTPMGGQNDMIVFILG